MELSPDMKELDKIIADLGNTKTTVKELNRIVGNRFDKSQCRSALEKAGKLERVGRGASLEFKPVHDYVKSLADKTPAREIVEKFGINRKAAIDILQTHGRFLPTQNHDRRKKTLGQPLPPTAAQLARELPAPMTSREFAERHKVSLKTAYAALREAKKFLPAQAKQKPAPALKAKSTTTKSAAVTPRTKLITRKVKAAGNKSFDDFMKGILKAAKVKADRYNYID